MRERVFGQNRKKERATLKPARATLPSGAKPALMGNPIYGGISEAHLTISADVLLGSSVLDRADDILGSIDDIARIPVQNPLGQVRQKGCHADRSPDRFQSG
jgi:hypothetical protein